MIAGCVRATDSQSRYLRTGASIDYLEFTRFLVARSIDSISLNPDSVMGRQERSWRWSSVSPDKERRLRQFMPKDTDLSGYTHRELSAIAHRLNTRPRKRLGLRRLWKSMLTCAGIHTLQFILPIPQNVMRILAIERLPRQ